MYRLIYKWNRVYEGSWWSCRLLFALVALICCWQLFLALVAWSLVLAGLCWWDEVARWVFAIFVVVGVPRVVDVVRSCEGCQELWMLSRCVNWCHYVVNDVFELAQLVGMSGWVLKYVQLLIVIWGCSAQSLQFFWSKLTIKKYNGPNLLGALMHGWECSTFNVIVSLN